MVKTFIPCLIDTVVWEAYTWESLRCEVSEKVWKLIEKEDVEALYKLVRDEVKEHPEEKVKARIKDFIGDVKGAKGAVAVRDEIYQEVILALLELEDED